MNTIDLSNLQKKALYKSKYRGTKEADVIIGGFVNDIYNKVDEKYLELLLDFLELHDQDIFSMIEGTKPIHENYNHILADITKYKQDYDKNKA